MQVLPSVYDETVAAAKVIVAYLEQRPGVLTQVDTVGGTTARTWSCTSQTDGVRHAAASRQTR
jgi:hypothetical protein